MSFILSPTAAGVGTTTVVATGDIAQGATVIMNSDGTVTTAGLVSNNDAISFGAAQTIATAASIEYIASVYDPIAKKIVVVYAVTSGSNYAIVGTVSGTTISWGTPVSISAYTGRAIAGCFNTANGTSVFTISYTPDNVNWNNYVFTISVSGTVPTIGTLYVNTTSTFGPTQASAITYDANANKCLIFYNDGGLTAYATAVVATVSGTTISFGTPNVFNSVASNNFTASYDPIAQKTVVIYAQSSASTRANVGTISGTTVSFGSQTTVMASDYIGNVSSGIYDSVNNKTAFFYPGGTGKGFGVVATVSGTTATFGTPSQFTSTLNPGFVSSAFNTSISKVDVGWIKQSGQLLTYALVATISGTTITFGTIVNVSSGSNVQSAALSYDANSQKAVFVTSGLNAYGYVGSVGSATNLTATNFFGISTTAASSGQSAVINTIGAINSKQTGLTAGTGYYVQNDGTLATSAGSPSIYAGLATSATSILIKG
jgi:hypothetical protein